MPERFVSRLTRRRSPEDVRHHAGLKAVLAVTLIVLGVASFLAPTATAVPSVRLVGAILVVAGIFQTSMAIAYDRSMTMLGSLGLGLANIGIGGLFVSDPHVSIRVLSLALAIAQVVIGFDKTVMALRDRCGHWKWTLALGLLLLAFGTMIAMDWPTSGLTAIGRFVGINLAVEGLTWLRIIRQAVTPPAPRVTIAPESAEAAQPADSSRQPP